MYGKVRRRSKKSAFDIQTWTYFDVLTVMRRKEIHKLAVKLSKHPAGSPRYLSSYKLARTKVEKKLTDDQRRKYKAMAKEWSERKLPRKVQHRYVRGNYSRMLQLADFYKYDAQERAESHQGIHIIYV
jgi:hypothetical protein